MSFSIVLFSIRQKYYILFFHVCEKYLANEKDVFWAFVYVEKAFDAIVSLCMWQCKVCIELDEKC